MKIRNIRSLINGGDLVFDIIVIAFTAFILGRVNPEGKGLVRILEPWAVFALGMGICYFITLHMGTLYRQYNEHFDSGALRVLMKIIFFLGITGAYLSLILFFAAFHIMPWTGLAREMDIMIVLFPVFPLLWGLQTVFDYDEMKEILYVLYVPLTVAIPLVPISSCMVGTHTGWYLGLAAFVVFIAAGATPLLMRKAFRRISAPSRADRALRLRKEGRDAREIEEILAQERGTTSLPGALLKGLFLNILVPAATALALLFWQNMTVETLRRAYGNWGLVAGNDAVLVSLFLCGIVPLRALSQFAPPLKPVNMAVAAASMAYYIFALLRAVP